MTNQNPEEKAQDDNFSISGKNPSVPDKPGHLPLSGEELRDKEGRDKAAKQAVDNFGNMTRRNLSHEITATKPPSQDSPPYKGGVPEGRGGLKLNNLKHLKTFRKALRNKLTPAEARLWTNLKSHQLDGRKFRRQHSVANYILDFYCPSEKLAIELDGEAHNNPAAAEYDYERDLFLRHTCIRVLRFENRIVFENAEWLLDQVRSYFGWWENHPAD